MSNNGRIIYYMKTIKNYCPNCKRETTHVIWTEDADGESGFSRVVNFIFTAGTSALFSYTYCKCLSCNKITELD